MKTVYLVPGTGGTFYCQNCVRDIALLRQLQVDGIDIISVPMYLPARIGEEEVDSDVPVFYGAIGLYLAHHMPWLQTPLSWLRKLMNSRSMLAYAARKSGTTRAHGLETMTISMLHGKQGQQKGELKRLLKWLQSDSDIELIHVSNALLLGVGAAVKEALGIPLVCTLQDEEQWIDAMDDPYRQEVWDLIRSLAQTVDCFIPVSETYSCELQDKLGITASKMKTVYLGIEPDTYRESPLPDNPPVIGYMARVAQSMGLDILLEALIQLRQIPEFAHTRLHINGGQTGDDIPFINLIKERALQAGLIDSIQFYEQFDSSGRAAFLEELTIMCVPARAGESFGLFQIEAMAAGVPVLLPELGGYPEIIARTEGGMTYTPNTAEALCKAMRKMLIDKEKLSVYGQAGRKSVSEAFTVAAMAEGVGNIYRQLITGKKGET